MLTDFNDFWHTASWRNLTLVDCKFAHLTWESITHYLAKYKVVHKFESTSFSSKKVGVFCGKINGSSAIESVQSDHPVHGRTLPVVSAIDPRCISCHPQRQRFLASLQFAVFHCQLDSSSYRYPLTSSAGAHATDLPSLLWKLLY